MDCLLWFPFYRETVLTVRGICIAAASFLNYIFEKEKTENNLATVHDYAKADDDMFLYTFSKALLVQHDGDNEEGAKII